MILETNDDEMMSSTQRGVVPSTRGLRAVYSRATRRLRSCTFVYAPCTLRVRAVCAPCTLRVRSCLHQGSFGLRQGSFGLRQGSFGLHQGSFGLHQGYLRFTSGLSAV